jgi:phosphoribosyl 1,2-cyclic phosphodiesterase
MTCKITFWGTRGSIPTPGSPTTRYGGNTPCVAVECADRGAGHLVILDAGTGIRPLGRALTQHHNGPVAIDLFLSHTHWDHIQGLPFFAPFFQPGNAVHIWGPKQGDVDLRTILRQQMDPVVFPVPIEGLAARLDVDHVDPGRFEIDGFAVRTIRLRHPGNTLGYRLTPSDGEGSVAYVTDNELGSGGEYDVGPSWRREFLEFLDGVTILIHDAMFTPAELVRHRGWGHSSCSEAVKLAAEAGVRRLVLFHHLPEHDDAAMDLLVGEAQEAAEGTDLAGDVLAATEGMELWL